MMRRLAELFAGETAQAASLLLQDVTDWTVVQSTNRNVWGGIVTHVSGVHAELYQAALVCDMYLNGERLGFWERILLRPGVVRVIERRDDQKRAHLDRILLEVAKRRKEGVQ